MAQNYCNIITALIAINNINEKLPTAQIRDDQVVQEIIHTVRKITSEANFL